MPALKFKAVEASRILSISRELVDELQELVQCPRDYFTLEVVQSVFISDGTFVDGNPMVEISWFDRGQDLQDKVAECITRFINQAGYRDVDVVFLNLDKNKYYENGKHF